MHSDDQVRNSAGPTYVQEYFIFKKKEICLRWENHDLI